MKMKLQIYAEKKLYMNKRQLLRKTVNGFPQAIKRKKQGKTIPEDMKLYSTHRPHLSILYACFTIIS